MNRRMISVLFFALAVASVTSYVLYRLILVRVQSQGHVTVPANQLVVAKHDIQIGTLMQAADLAEVPWGAPIPVEAVKTIQDAVGRGVLSNIYQNEPILEARLAQKGAGAGLAATIPMGMRVVALKVNEVIGLAGFVVAGMRVDVLMAGNAPNNEQTKYGTQCKTILQNIQVLSADQKIDQNAAGKPEAAQVVNLLVTPDQAEVLNLAMSETKVQLVLRNPLDTKAQDTPGTSIASLFGAPPKPASFAQVSAPRRPPVVAAAPPPPPPADVVEVFHGVKRSEETFDAPVRKKNP